MAIVTITLILNLAGTEKKEDILLSENTNTQTSEVNVDESIKNDDTISMLDEFIKNDDTISMLDESDTFKTEIETTVVDDSDIEPEEIDEEEPIVKPTQDASQDGNQDIKESGEDDEKDTTPTPDTNQNEEQDEDETDADISDPDEVAEYRDPDHEEDDPPQTVGAKWVDGVAVPMTNAEVDAFLKKIYATQSLEEYEALIDTVVYFNVGIDSTRLIWQDNYQE